MTSRTLSNFLFYLCKTQLILRCPWTYRDSAEKESARMELVKKTKSNTDSNTESCSNPDAKKALSRRFPLLFLVSRWCLAVFGGGWWDNDSVGSLSAVEPHKGWTLVPGPSQILHIKVFSYLISLTSSCVWLWYRVDPFHSEKRVQALFPLQREDHFGNSITDSSPFQYQAW